MTLDREDIQAIADAVVQKLMGQPGEGDNLLPYDPVKYKEAIIEAKTGNTKALKEYLKTYRMASPGLTRQ